MRQRLFGPAKGDLQQQEAPTFPTYPARDIMRILLKEVCGFRQERAKQYKSSVQNKAVINAPSWAECE